jgi:hypothetical protein
MTGTQQNEQQDELRDLDVRDEQAEAVTGGKMHLEDISLGVVAKPPTRAGSR